MSDRMVANVRRFSKATGYAKFLLLTIASHLHPQAVYAFPSLDTLAQETTLSKPTVIHLIRTLEALGELEVRRGHGRGHPNRYRVTLDHEVSPERSTEDDDDRPKGQPRLYLLTPEKVNEGAEKGKDTPGKGQGSGRRRVGHAEPVLWDASGVRAPPPTGDAVLCPGVAPGPLTISVGGTHGHDLLALRQFW